jgi:AraC-like DNA-binding protein
VSRPITGMSLECGKGERERFFARLTGARHAGVTLLRFERAGTLVHRSAEDIARFPSDNLLIYAAPSTPSWFRTCEGGEFVAPPNALVVGYADVPFSHAPVDGVDYRCVLASLPAALVGSFRRARRHPLPRAIATDAGVGSLLMSYFEAWSREVATLEGEAFDLAAQTLAHLAALAHDVAEPLSEPSRDALAAAQRAAAERFIAHTLHRAALSPALVAAKLEISLRRLHALFEPTGVSVARRILAQRLAAAKRLLIDLPDLPVTDVAYRCGFDSLATFYRAFKAAFAMTATEFRAAQREPR